MIPSIELVTLQLWDAGWDDWTDTVVSISIQRGGAVTVDVGVMTVVLARQDDPLADDAILPGQPVRVVRKGTSDAIFTGVVQDADVGIVRDGGGQTRNGITVVAVDAVASHVKNTRYGAVTDGGVGHETWVARVTRLAASSDTPVSLPTEPVTPYPWECQDVAYTSSLASHFDLACQTVGANWWVGSDNTTRFRPPDDATASVGTFSDLLSDPNQYEDILIGSGTRQVVNVLKIENHGRGNDGNTFDIATTFEEPPSIAAWGARAAVTDMCVWDADTKLSGRAQAVFDAFADPVRGVDQIVWDGQQNPVLATLLDIQSPVTVKFGAETFETRVVTLAHDIGPTWWTITIGTSVRGVPEAQAVYDAYADMAATGAEPIDRDARAPQAPTGVTADPFAAWQGGSIALAVQAEWDAVTLGDNGAPIGVSLYEVWGRPDDGSTPPRRLTAATGLSVAITDPAFAIGDDWLIKVRAASDNNVWSPFSSEASVTLVEPAEELSAATSPQVSAQPGIGIIQWNGNLSTGPAPGFLRDVLVETAPTEDAPDEEWSPVRFLFGGGDSAMIAAPAGASFFVRLVAFDRLGRAAPPSAAVLVSIPAAPASFLDISSLRVALIEAGFSGDLILTANGQFEVLAGRVDETRSVFRVTSDGAEIRREGVASYLALLAEAVQLYGPSGAVGVEITAAGMEAPTVIASTIRQGPIGAPGFEWSVSADGDHLTLRGI